VVLRDKTINPLNAELNPICHFLGLLGAHHILHVSRIRVNIKKYYSVPAKCIYVLYGSQNRDYFSIQRKMTDWFCSRVGECLLSGTDWIFQNNSS
jgi:hypothetical protein